MILLQLFENCQNVELKLSKLLPGFYASIVLAFILWVELFDYVVHGRGDLREPGLGRKPNSGYGLKMGESNAQDVVGVTQLCRIS